MLPIVNQYNIDRGIVTTNLTFDMLTTYSILKSNDKYNNSYKAWVALNTNVYTKLKNELSNIWRIIVTKTFSVYLDQIIEDIYFCDVNGILDKCITHMKKIFGDYKEYFAINDPHINTTCHNDHNILWYLTGNILNDVFTKIINDDECMSNFKILIIAYSKITRDAKLIIETHTKIINKIKTMSKNCDIYHSNPEMHFSSFIPFSIKFEKDNFCVDKFIVSDIVGYGTYGCVVKYVDEKENKENKENNGESNGESNGEIREICIKIYFAKTADKFTLEKLNSSDILLGVTVKSVYLDKYSYNISNNSINLFRYFNYDIRKTHYLVMNYETPINKEFISLHKNDDKLILKILQDVTKKLLILANNNIYFTDIKHNNILYCHKTNTTYLIDLDSMYYLEKKNKITYSYSVLVSHMIPTYNKKTNITEQNIYIIEKIIVFKMSILIMLLYGYNLDQSTRVDICDYWNKFINDHFAIFNDPIFARIDNSHIDNIPSISELKIVFDDILYNESAC